MFGMPRFFKDMVRPEKGTFYSLAYKEYLNGVIKYSKITEHKGKLRAYLAARKKALKLDLEYYHPEVGVYWVVTSKKPNDPYESKYE